MIKLSDTTLVIPLKVVFSNCLNEGVFPEVWKYSDLIPVHKNERIVEENYRPIFLLSIIGKIFEKLIYDTFYPYLPCHADKPKSIRFLIL